MPDLVLGESLGLLLSDRNVALGTRMKDPPVHPVVHVSNVYQVSSQSLCDTLVVRVSEVSVYRKQQSVFKALLSIFRRCRFSWVGFLACLCCQQILCYLEALCIFT